MFGKNYCFGVIIRVSIADIEFYRFCGKDIVFETSVCDRENLNLVPGNNPHPAPSPPPIPPPEKKEGKYREKERYSKEKLLKGCHQGQNDTVLAILECLEFKNCSCRSTMVTGN